MKSNAPEETKAGFISLSDLASLVSGIPKDAFGEAACSDPKNWKATEWHGYNCHKPANEAYGTHQSREWIGHSQAEYRNTLNVINKFVKKLKVDIFSIHTGLPLCREPNAFDLVIGLLWWEDANKVLTAMRQTARLPAPGVGTPLPSVSPISTQEALISSEPHARSSEKVETQTVNSTLCAQSKTFSSSVHIMGEGIHTVKSVKLVAYNEAFKANDIETGWQYLINLSTQANKPAVLKEYKNSEIYFSKSSRAFTRKNFSDYYHREKKKSVK